jgi:hypothetical protein
MRKACWFAVLAFVSACWMGMLGILPGEAFAGMIPSRGAGSAETRAEDLRRVQIFLEQKVVLQKLEDYGVSPQEANAKIREMSDKDLHLLAAMTDKVPAGSDPIDSIFILLILSGIIVILLILLGILSLKTLADYLGKKKSQPGGTENTAPAPAAK